MRTAGTVEDYLSQFPQQQRATLEKIRRAIKDAAPAAEETISYGMPAYKLHGVLVYFGGFRNHFSFFPASYSVIKEFQEELKAYRTSKGTIQFPIDKPIPSSLIKKMVRARISENEARLKAKAAKRKAGKANSHQHKN